MSRTSPPGDFTRYLRLLVAEAGPPAAEEFETVWSALRGALASELRRRGLWGLSPRLLGIVGAERWAAPSGEPYDDALEELAADCYEYVFLRRAQSLAAQLTVKDSIEGLVFRSIRNFLFERQKANDPIGYRTFELLRSAVERAERLGILTLDSASGRIDNATVLRPAGPAASVSVESDPPDALVDSWLDDLLPDLLSAEGASKSELVERLAPRLEEIPGEVAFGELVAPMKRTARRRWHALLDTELGPRARDVDVGDGDGRVASVAPSPVVEDAESYRVLTACVARRLGALEAPERTRRYLEELWRFLGSWAATAGPGDEAWSHRRLAGELGIPRARLPELFATLESLVEECRRAKATSDPVRSSPEGDDR